MSDPFNHISPLFIRLFRSYTRLLFYRRFKYVWLFDRYRPSPERSTIFYANHSSWWDGLIPLLLNEYHYRQNGRALMEDRQITTYPFFRKIGAVPVARDHPRQAMHILREAAAFLDQPGRSLYIFPQGRMFTECAPLQFESGLARLSELTTLVDIVPLAISVTTMRYDKPELLLRTSEPVVLSGEMPRLKRNELLIARLQQLLQENQKACREGPEEYQRLV